MGKLCKSEGCGIPVVGNRLYCDVHNMLKIAEMGYDPNSVPFRNLKFVEKPDLSKAVVPFPKSDKYYKDNEDYDELKQTNKKNG